MTNSTIFFEDKYFRIMIIIILLLQKVDSSKGASENFLDEEEFFKLFSYLISRADLARNIAVQIMIWLYQLETCEIF